MKDVLQIIFSKKELSSICCALTDYRDEFKCNGDMSEAERIQKILLAFDKALSNKYDKNTD